ncbi:methyltransferase domain-containing protein [Parasphingopyxis sp.]|uniref:methyltransferase domain-containing protein n=1 Tax=Parasphingopyxis sp. TaxID=1920299 RepID=UPI002610F09F|nr:methyltransferase domain-containing protein [Parasphingopyxis sp.]
MEEFCALLDNGKPEQALDFFLSQAGALADSNIHRRVKLNHFRYAARILEHQTRGKHGIEKLTRKLRSINENLKGIEIPQGAFLDFGCGGHDPLGLATAHYLNGFDRAIACDLFPIHVPAYSAFSMYEILANMRGFPHNYLRPDGDLAEFRRRLIELDLQPFIDRDFEAGLAALTGKVVYRLDDIVNLDVEDEELALAVSFAVLEHVMDHEQVYDWLFRKTKPGGIQFHFVDLVDHRSYGGGVEFDPWSFLTEEIGPPNVNRLRASEHRTALENVGFEVLVDRRKAGTIPLETKEKLIPPWSEMSEAEIGATKISLVLRKPV